MATGFSHDAGSGSGDIEDGGLAEADQLSGDFDAAVAIRQAHIDDYEVRLVMSAERDGLGERAGYAADLVAVRDKNVLRHVSNHEIVFCN